MAVLIKNVTAYQKAKPAYDAYREAKDRDGYRAAREQVIILHEAAARSLKAAGISGRLPNTAALQAEYEKLQQQKAALYADYEKIKKLVREYDVLKWNRWHFEAERQAKEEKISQKVLILNAIYSII